MSDAIKVGDRVLFGPKADSSPHIVAAIIGEDAWVKPTFYVGMGFIQPLDSLTRIEPEKVVLTPKYAVAQRLRTSPLRLNITADNIYVVKGPVVGYELESGGWLPESLLFPIPEPCPTCKGSGKSEGSA